MDNIVFICTGNTCRSPMAEALFRAAGGEQKTGMRAVSAGLHTIEGLPASDHAVTAVAELGGELVNHSSHVLTEQLVTQAQCLLCMTAAQFDAVQELFPQAKDKLYMLCAQDVSDPFGADLTVYRQAAAQIQQGVQAVIARLTR